MSKSQHTPGPWSITSAIDDPKGKFYVRGIQDGADMPLVVTRHGPAQANAHLIAAAPELLASLSALLEWGTTHTNPTEPNSPHALLVQAHNAIAKAEGRKL